MTMSLNERITEVRRWRADDAKGRPETRLIMREVPALPFTAEVSAEFEIGAYDSDKNFYWKPVGLLNAEQHDLLIEVLSDQFLHPSCRVCGAYKNILLHDDVGEKQPICGSCKQLLSKANEAINPPWSL